MRAQMEGADPQLPVPAAQQALEPLLHLVRGLVGEGDGEDVEGGQAPLQDEVGGAVREDAGLAASCAGEDQQWAIAVQNGFALTVVEPLEDGRIGVVGHTRYLWWMFGAPMCFPPL